MTANRILLAVDDSPASNRAASYVGDVLRKSAGHRVLLLHVLPPPLPFDTEDRGGLADDPAPAAEPDASAPILDGYRALLEALGVDASLIEANARAPEPLQSLADAILDEATGRNCDTVVVGRTEAPWYKRAFRRHLGDQLVSKARGMAVWIVE